jgi:hypothetical protein
MTLWKRWAREGEMAAWAVRNASTRCEAQAQHPAPHTVHPVPWGITQGADRAFADLGG